MNQMITVPHNKLMRDPNNVREIYIPSGILELAASIQAKGLIQDPVVRKSDKKSTFLVTAGGRLLGALLTPVRKCTSEGA